MPHTTHLRATGGDAQDAGAAGVPSERGVEEASGDRGPHGASGRKRDRYPDALRAGALLVVVFGHWIATLPRLEDGRMVDTGHLLTVWDGAGVLSWFLQVVPLFVFVSAAVSTPGAGCSDRSTSP